MNINKGLVVFKFLNNLVYVLVWSVRLFFFSKIFSERLSSGDKDMEEEKVPGCHFSTPLSAVPSHIKVSQRRKPFLGGGSKTKASRPSKTLYQGCGSALI